MNISEIITNLRDLAGQSFDAEEFPYRFLEIYHAPSATMKKLRAGNNNKADTPGDVFWQGKFYFRPAQPGKAMEALDALQEKQPRQKNRKARFILATDGVEIAALDTRRDRTLHCDYQALNDNFDFFLPLAGIEKYEGVEENKADIKASNCLARLHDEIVSYNPDWNRPEKRHELNQFMTRVLFCLFCEDTGSFKKDQFVKVISESGGENGEHIQDLLTRIFDVMNIPDNDDRRSDLPRHINDFPYVNGGLFADQCKVPAFNKRAKRLLSEAAALDWQEINPDIFGSMIQAIVDPEMRGNLGMHYTSVPNIMKVLHPLFLQSLEEEFADAQGHREEKSRLNKLLDRIAKMRVFDPACGSGNFLIIAYRELRKLEMRIFQRLDELSGGTTTWRERSGVKLSNFYGIEIADFAVETAKLSLWIAEYQMNEKFRETFGQAPSVFPLEEGGNIYHGNALHMDWHEICPLPDDDEVETYIVGNPPYRGARWQTPYHKADMEHVFAPLTNSYNNMDLIAAWYLKAAEYCHKQNAESALVATNTICQGEHVSLLWPLIFNYDIEIGFAHKSFKWKNLATNNAGVTCVIVSLRQKSNTKKVLFHNEIAYQVKNIGPYLRDMPNTIVYKSSTPVNGLPIMVFGNMPNEGGNLILSAEERHNLINKYPETTRLIRRLYGSQEFIQGIERWCLWIKDEDLELARSIPDINDRIEKVRDKRLKSNRASTKALAKWPHQFGEIRDMNADHAIIIPRVSSENRPYLPVGFITDGSVIQDRAFAIYDGPPWVMALIASRLHQQWISTVCVRLRTDFS